MSRRVLTYQRFMMLDELGPSSSGSLTPVFKGIHNSEKEEGHKCSSLIPPDHRKSTNTSKQSTRSDWSSTSSYGNPLADSYAESYSVPITRKRRRALGMSGTMGGTTGPESDESDPDSDVPDELRFLLATHSNRGSVVESLSPGDEDEGLATAKPTLDVEMSVARTASPRVPDVAPILQLPTFRASLIDEEDNHPNIDDGGATSDEDTKKSFDFTGGLKKLNESGASDRRSFVEQLENVFRTPAEVDLCYDFGGHLRVEVPPVPSIPVDLRMAVDADSSAGTSTMETLDSSNSQSQLLNMRRPTMIEMSQEDALSQESKTNSRFDMFSTSRIVDMKEPTLLQGSDSINSTTETHDILFSGDAISSSVELVRSTASKTSDGQLNDSFKFGGLPKHGSIVSGAAVNAFRYHSSSRASPIDF